MRILLDSNLSRKLPGVVKSDLFVLRHVWEFDLSTASDLIIWEYARSENFTVATKDSDFTNLSLTKGFPPKVIIIASGNSSTGVISELFVQKSKEIVSFITESNEGILILGKQDRQLAFTAATY